MASVVTKPRVIWLQTCGCSHCKGRAAVCMDAFEWVDKRDPAHARRHAQEDLLTYFDRLPLKVKEALLTADVNVCSWCAEIWAQQYGVAKTAQLVGDVRYIDDTRAITPIDGWGSLQTRRGTKT